MSVLLPAPFSPSTAWTSPSHTVMSMLSLATRLKKRLVSPRPSRRGRPRSVSRVAALRGASTLVMVGPPMLGSLAVDHPRDGGEDALLHNGDRLADVDGEAALGIGDVA